MRYFLEFFTSQYLGRLSDIIGRKPVLSRSLLGVFFEFLVVAIYPCLATVILSKILSGVFDAVGSISNAIAADIAYKNKTAVSDQFGMLYSVMGFAFVFGPVIGSVLATYSIQLCFFISSLISLAACLIATYWLQETSVYSRSSSNESAYSTSSLEQPQQQQQQSIWTRYIQYNPFIGLKIFFQNADLTYLSVPFVLGNMAYGVYPIWILYMHQRFHSTIIEAGIFMTVVGLTGVIVQGCLLKFIVPRILSERSTALCCLLAISLQYFLFGMASSISMFYAIMLGLCFNSMYLPTMQAIMVHKSDHSSQGGTIQGAIGSLKMITSFISSLLFPFIFNFGIHTNPPVVGLPFYFGSFLCLCGGAALYAYLQYEARTAPLPLQQRSTTVSSSGSDNSSTRVSADVLRYELTATTDDCVPLVRAVSESDDRAQ